MNKEQFIKYATDFSSLDTQSLEELRLIINEFPHFQSAWILFAKNLHNIKDVRFESNIKIAATHVSDRKILKRIIDGTYSPNSRLNNQDARDKKQGTRNKEQETRAKIQDASVEPTANSQQLNNQETRNKEQEANVINFMLQNLRDIHENLKSFPISENISTEIIPISERKSNKTEAVNKIIDVKDVVVEVKVEPNLSSNSNIEAESTFPEETKVSLAQKQDFIKPNSSAAERVLQNIENIKTGEVSQNENNQDFSNKSDLELIIAQRLRELGIKNDPPKEIVEEKTIIKEPKVSDIVLDEKPEEQLEIDQEIMDIEQFTSSKTESNLTKDYSKPDLKSDDYINFDFENGANTNKSKKISELNSEKKNELIDKFLTSNPRIVPQKEYTSNSSYSADLVLTEDEELFSETLAKIYIKQEHFDKAILTYEKLCLKYPEKNIYFAGQIERIKELIKNKQE